MENRTPARSSGATKFAERTLIIPDIHERIDQLKKLASRIGSAKRRVFLGDWFDTFGQRYTDEIIALLKAAIAEGDDVLLGNHDCHYAFDNHGFTCSGYDWPTKQAVRNNISKEEWKKTRLWTMVGPYLVSHAGFCENTLQYKTDEVHDEVMDEALRGGYDGIFEAGRARGGRAIRGGPTWLDWNHEFEHIPRVPQIVGHTAQKDVPATKGMPLTENNPFLSYCLDTNLRHVAWVDEETGEVTIEEV